MGLDPGGLSRDQIQRIEIEAGDDNQGPNESAPEPSPEQGPEQAVPKAKQKRERDKMTSDVWEHFKKGKKQPDKSYTATCIYCGAVYKMGNSKSTTPLWHHFNRQCKKVPSSKRQKTDPMQKYLQVEAAGGNFLS